MYRLLIVDDKQAGEALRKAIDWAAAGFDTVACACSYAEAVSKALDLQPHAALVAAEVDGYKGVSLVNHLHSVGQKTVFALTMPRKDFAEIRRAMRAGVRDVLVKPVSGDALAEFACWVVQQELGGNLPKQREENHGVDPVLQIAYSSLSKITNKIILLVHSDYRRSLSLTSIAEGYNLSSKYIGRVFLKDTGMRFTEYLTAYRMLEARNLIQQTGEKISVIASMVGYSQLNNFYTHFHAHFGVSPSSLRKFDTEKEIRYEKSV